MNTSTVYVSVYGLDYNLHVKRPDSSQMLPHVLTVDTQTQRTQGDLHRRS